MMTLELVARRGQSSPPFLEGELEAPHQAQSGGRILPITIEVLGKQDARPPCHTGGADMNLQGDGHGQTNCLPAT